MQERPEKVEIKSRATAFARMKQYILQQGLGFRLKLFFALISLVPLISLGLISFTMYSGSMKETTINYTGDIINEININMFLRFSKIDDISKILLNNVTLKTILSKEEAQANGDFLEDSPKVTQMLQSIMFSNDYITSIYILPGRNSNIYSTGLVTGNYGTGLFSEEYRNSYKETDIYRQTIGEYNNYRWWAPREILDKRVFLLTRKIYDVDKGDLGVMVIHIDEKILDDMYDRLNRERISTILLTDEKGNIIYHPDKEMLDRPIGLESFPRISQSTKGSFVIGTGGDKSFVVFDTFFVTGWKFVALIPYSKLMAQVSRVGNITIFIALLCLILIITVSTLITKSILSPVKKLMRLMKKGASGQMDVRFDGNTLDETGQLGESFNTMMASIQKLMKMVEEESRSRVEAQIKALEAHINPHFLYNTLASIYWNAIAKENDEIARMSLSLSNFFKLGLNKGKEFTTVGREVEHAQEYLSIQKMLYEDRFDLVIDVDRDILEYKTIKLILQPLVENSLVHGLENKDGRGLIKIDVFKREDRIVFKVLDNGEGIKALEETGLEEIINRGYGLKNVQERLRLYFHNDFTIDCRSVPREETVFEISIPAIKFEGGESNV